MKKLMLYTVITALGFICTSCTSISKDTQEEFNQDAIYFIKTDGPKYVEYVEKDLNATARDKLTIRRRVNNLNNLIDSMNKN